MDLGLDNDFESDDSFFDDPKISKKPRQLPKTSEKKSLEDIFGFEENKKLEEKNPLENVQSSPALKSKVRFNLEDNAANEKPVKSKTVDWLGSTEEPDFPKKDSKTNPKIDILDDSKKPFDLLDDILPQRSRKTEQPKTTSFEDILRDSKIQKSGPASLEKSDPGSLERLDKEGGSSKSQRNPPDGLSTILEPPQGSRRGRRGSSVGVADVLGLFGSGPSSSEFLGASKASSGTEERSTTRNLAKDNIPDWLGGSSTTLNKSDTTISLPKAEPQRSEIEIPKAQIVMAVNSEEPTKPQSAPEAPISNKAESSFQSSMSNLQAQESFLLVSLQLKKYEENLSEIKNQQHEILRKQESQFDVFLNKYIEKQKSIEQEMLSQQERINQHIRVMALRTFEDDKVVTKKQDEITEEDVTEKLVYSLKQRHAEEFFLMEESYKKQISLLEKSSEQLEHRLNQEMENLSKTHEEKLENLNTQHNEELKYWTEKIKLLDEKHKEELNNLKDNHLRVLREVKDEFLDQIERFKEQRSRENELFANSTDFSQKLSFSLETLSKNEEILGQLQEKVVNDYNILSVARESSIENKEKEIAAMRIALEKCRSQAEKERSQLLALVRTLEQKISEQNQNTQEERWALQQAAATIAARSVAFDREIAFSRDSLEREREQLKTLKEALLAEQERTTMQLTEEKLKLSAEKSRLEVSAKLVNNYEVEKIKTEAETAIQVAKELTEKLNLERNFVQRQKVELESFRNKLLEKERSLLEREEGIEEMRRAMQQKSGEDRRMIQEARYLENRYKEKLSELQSQAISLSNREKKLAEEKLLVSRERLALYTSMKSQSGHKKCMLCKAEEDHVNKSELLPLGYPATDPEFIRLRLEAVEDERNSEVSREDSFPNNLLNSDVKVG